MLRCHGHKRFETKSRLKRRRGRKLGSATEDPRERGGGRAERKKNRRGAQKAGEKKAGIVKLTLQT